MNEKLTDAFYTPDPNDPNPLDLAVFVIKSMLPNAYNGYVNGEWSMVKGQLSIENKGTGGYWRYNEPQMNMIQQMLNGINTVAPESIGEFLSGIKEDIVAGKLSYEEQAPLLIATAIGKRDHEYWTEQINTPWTAYLNGDIAINYAHLAGIVSAAMQGVLLAYGIIKPPQI